MLTVPTEVVVAWGRRRGPIPTAGAEMMKSSETCVRSQNNARQQASTADESILNPLIVPHINSPFSDIINF